jgi:Family of unknown function (DUF6731)
MLPRTIKIDFYKTEDANGDNLDITPTILQAYALDFPARRVDFGDSFVCLYSARRHRGRLLGEVLKTKMTELPDKVSRNTGRLQALGLAADEGIGHRAHFLYDSANAILLFQRDREVRPPAFVHSVSNPTNQHFALSLIFKANALERLDRMRIVRKITFKVARPDDRVALRNLDPSAGHAIDILNGLGGRQIEIDVSVGRAKLAGLERQPALRAIRSLFQRRDEEVEKVIVSGRETPDGATEMIDLLEDRLVFQTEVNLRGRELDRRDCDNALLTAYDENVAYLRGYRNPE